MPSSPTPACVVALFALACNPRAGESRSDRAAPADAGATEPANSKFNADELAEAHQASWDEARDPAIELIQVVHGPRPSLGPGAAAEVNVARLAFMQRGRGVDVESLTPLQRTEYRAIGLTLALADAVDSGRSGRGYDPAAFVRRVRGILRALEVQALAGTSATAEDLDFFSTLGEVAQELHGASLVSWQGARKATAAACEGLELAGTADPNATQALQTSCARWAWHMQQFQLPTRAAEPAAGESPWDQRARARRLSPPIVLAETPSPKARATYMRTRWGWSGSERVLADKALSTLKRISKSAAAAPQARGDGAAEPALVDEARCEAQVSVLKTQLPKLGLEVPSCASVLRVLTGRSMTRAELRSWLLDRGVTAQMVNASRLAAGKLIGELRSPSRAAEFWMGSVFAGQFGWDDAVAMRHAQMAQALCRGLSLLSLSDGGEEARSSCQAYPDAANEARADPVTALDGLEFALIPRSKQHNEWMLKWPHAPLGWLLSAGEFEGPLQPDKPLATVVERPFDDDDRPGIAP